ncbi:hypothetical protein R1sor_013593 [Riccia sorocarpa]|uniref:Uncharacterized protein n=1 Tax=Riccia sorocarpa TaxID=122646 RepID=A0ABD3H9V2_9MARC
MLHQAPRLPTSLAGGSQGDIRIPTPSAWQLGRNLPLALEPRGPISMPRSAADIARAAARHQTQQQIHDSQSGDSEPTSLADQDVNVKFSHALANPNGQRVSPANSNRSFTVDGMADQGNAVEADDVELSDAYADPTEGDGGEIYYKREVIEEVMEAFLKLPDRTPSGDAGDDEYDKTHEDEDTAETDTIMEPNEDIGRANPHNMIEVGATKSQEQR